MKKTVLLITLVVLIATKGFAKMNKDGLYAEFKTSEGNFICELYYKNVPVVVGNFVGLVEGSIDYFDDRTGKKKSGPFYDGLVFHRVIDGFMIQGGCPLGTGTGGPGYRFPDQIDETLKHEGKGILSMANAGPDTNGSQFFITLGSTPHLNGKHAVFGKIVEGMDVVEAIGKTSTDDRDRPTNPITIKTVIIHREGSGAKGFDAAGAFAQKDSLAEEREKEAMKKMQSLLKRLGVDPASLQTTSTGLKYTVIKDGSGSKAGKRATIEAHYTGYFTSGKKFDSSWDRGQPLQFQVGVGQVIPGWDEALVDMKRGERRVLVIPYQLAYGEQGYPGAIPPKSTLIFDVELVNIVSN
jgi:peptidyl-prolyl cis-trans isomerase A (cyclophilin A)